MASLSDDRDFFRLGHNFLVVMAVVVSAASPFPGYDVIMLPLAAAGALLGFLGRARWSVQYAYTVAGVFCLWALITSGWSELPEASVRLSLTFLVLALLVARAVQVLAPEGFLAAVLQGCRIALSLSLAVGVFVPSVGIVSGEYETGALQGIFVHRNSLAFFCILAIVTAGCVWRNSRRTVVLVGDIFLAVVCLVGAQSQTSFLTLGVVAGFWIAIEVVKRSDRVIATVALSAFASVGTCVVYLAINSLDAVTQGLGRDTTLTGRTDVWAAVLEEIGRRPITGAGWFATWVDGLAVTYRMWSAAGFAMYHAHDGYLDLLLQVGVIGLGLFLLLLIPALVLPIGRLVVGGRSQSTNYWPALVSIVLIVGDVSESQFTTLAGWLFMVGALAVSVAKVRIGVDETTPTLYIDGRSSD